MVTAPHAGPSQPGYVEIYQQVYWVTYRESGYKEVGHFINHIKTIKMKKLLAVVFVGILASCGSGSSSSTTDSTTIKTDSTTTIVTDSTKTMVDTTKKATDTMKMDSTRK
jgi:hypothetical protein